MVQFTAFVDPQKTTLAVTSVNAAPNGKKTLSFPGNTVVSVQPNSTQENPVIQDRPEGANGVFEQCDVDGQVATYWYDWTRDDGHGGREAFTVGPISIPFMLVTGKSK